MARRQRKTRLEDRIGHFIVVIGIPAASVWAIATGQANQWTWLSLVSALFYLRNDRAYADAIRTISAGLSAKFSSTDRGK